MAEEENKEVSNRWRVGLGGRLWQREKIGLVFPPHRVAVCRLNGQDSAPKPGGEAVLAEARTGRGVMRTRAGYLLGEHDWSVSGWRNLASAAAGKRTWPWIVGALSRKICRKGDQAPSADRICLSHQQWEK